MRFWIQAVACIALFFSLSLLTAMAAGWSLPQGVLVASIAVAYAALTAIVASTLQWYDSMRRTSYYRMTHEKSTNTVPPIPKRTEVVVPS